MRGGERVVEALCKLLPDADIFTLFYDPESVSETIKSHRIHTSFLQPLKKYHRSLLPLMPMALENLDLRDYDLVVSSESGPAKGVLTPSQARHVCYCHTPMRYLWELYPAYRKDWTRSRAKRALMTPLTNFLRVWDYASAARVDDFVANSRNVQRRIWKTYRRESEVIYPPVAVDMLYSKPSEDFYLAVAELVAYKRIDLAVRAFSNSGRKLKIVGAGPEYKALRAMAGPNVEFCGRVSDKELRDLYARARALIQPADEDFGITTVEALGSGKPVIAAGVGGSLEIVPEQNPVGGRFFSGTRAEDLQRAVEEWDKREPEVRPAELQKYATRFSEQEFLRRMGEVLFPSGKDARDQ
jgi:glycosyltransferase involved in cell wall biosynthesis